MGDFAPSFIDLVVFFFYFLLFLRHNLALGKSNQPLAVLDEGAHYLFIAGAFWSIYVCIWCVIIFWTSSAHES